MIKIVSFPIAVLAYSYEFEEEFNKRIETMQGLEAQGLKDLNQALAEGFDIKDKLETTINRMTYLRYTLYKQDAPPKAELISKILKKDIKRGSVLDFGDGLEWTVVHFAYGGKYLDCSNEDMGRHVFNWKDVKKILRS